jgi:hypothetical protein
MLSFLCWNEMQEQIYRTFKVTGKCLNNLGQHWITLVPGMFAHLVPHAGQCWNSLSSQNVWWKFVFSQTFTPVVVPQCLNILSNNVGTFSWALTSTCRIYEVCRCNDVTHYLYRFKRSQLVNHGMTAESFNPYLYAATGRNKEGTNKVVSYCTLLNS